MRSEPSSRLRLTQSQPICAVEKSPHWWSNQETPVTGRESPDTDTVPEVSRSVRE